MSVEKRVLLARPHAFIVNEMRPFLAETGHVPLQVESVDQLVHALAGSFHGAIVSTAVTSSVSADAATVFRLIRDKAPRLPVVFAGMADFRTMAATTERAVRGVAADPVIAGPQEYRAPNAANRASSLLVLRKEDWIPGAAREAALRALRTHFG